jgi:transketolase
MVYRALQAAEALGRQGLSVSVVNFHTIKPLDEDTLEELARRTGAVLTVEEHSIIGGLGSAVAEVLSERYPVPVRRLGVRDVFGQSGTPEQLLEFHGLTAENIAATAWQLAQGKGR